MSQDNAEDLSKSLDEARGLLEKRFPNLRCLRCDNDHFLLRRGDDSSWLSAYGDTRSVELICESCGRRETYSFAGLANKLIKR